MAGEAYPKQFRDLTKIFNGTTPASDLKMSDIFPIQHVDSLSATNTLNQVTVAQCLCQPVAVVNNTPNDGRYTADCVNFPDFSIRDTDNNHILYGLKVRVSFPNGITYGSVSGGTCPELNINGSGSLKMLAQGKTMAAGAASAGQTMEFTLIPYGNGEIAWDADSNVRESTSDYTIYTDGSSKYTSSQCDKKFVNWTIKNSSLVTKVTINEDGFFILTVSNAAYNNQKIGCYLIYKSSTQIIFISKIFENYITVTPNYNEVIITDYSGNGVECSVHKIGVYWE